MTLLLTIFYLLLFLALIVFAAILIYHLRAYRSEKMVGLDGGWKDLGPFAILLYLVSGLTLIALSVAAALFFFL